MRKTIFGVIMLAVVLGAGKAPAAEIALLNSSINTKEFFKRRYAANGIPCSVGTFLGEDEYKRYYLGWQYVLDGQPHNASFNFRVGGTSLLTVGNPVFDYDLITDADVTDQGLKPYKVLILSNTASLSQAQSRAIQQWVLKGGKLIATYGSGYKDIIENPHDPEGADPLKSQKGSTGGLHELWHDPWTKAFGTEALAPGKGIDVKILKNIGPTNLSEWSLQPTLSYGAEANLLVPRPENFRDALAFLTFDGDMNAFKRLYPAILLVKASRGQVVYFAYAPEFIVALAFDLAGHCSNDGNYDAAGSTDPGPQPNDIPNGFSVFDRVDPQLKIMRRAIEYMLTGN